MDKHIGKKVLKKIPYGLFVISASTPHRSAAILANWVMQVSFEPPLLAIAIECDSKMRHLFEESKHFSVNMLPAGSTALAKAFLKANKRTGASLSAEDFDLSPLRPPLLRAASDALICRVVNTARTGDHILFIAEVEEGVSRSEKPVLTLKETGLHYSR